MYLTRLRLDPRSAQVRRDLADPYEMHRTLARVFAVEGKQALPRILWRLEPGAIWSEPVVLVQARIAADWSGLLNGPNYLKHPAETRELDFESRLQPGKRLRFRLFANPTVTRAGKRQGLVAEDAQLAWLSRQGERYGFAVDAVLVSGCDLVHGRKGDTRISLLKACFEGRLQVLQPERLVEALQAGIGPGKAFGCGLLSLGGG